jgi:hypothetical protein
VALTHLAFAAKKGAHRGAFGARHQASREGQYESGLTGRRIGVD